MCSVYVLKWKRYWQYFSKSAWYVILITFLADWWLFIPVSWSFTCSCVGSTKGISRITCESNYSVDRIPSIHCIHVKGISTIWWVGDGFTGYCGKLCNTFCIALYLFLYFTTSNICMNLFLMKYIPKLFITFKFHDVTGIQYLYKMKSPQVKGNWMKENLVNVLF